MWRSQKIATGGVGAWLLVSAHHFLPARWPYDDRRFLLFCPPIFFSLLKTLPASLIPLAPYDISVALQKSTE
jgi:hypothetical protein